MAIKFYFMDNVTKCHCFYVGRELTYDPQLHLDLCIDEDEVSGCNRKFGNYCFQFGMQQK